MKIFIKLIALLILFSNYLSFSSLEILPKIPKVKNDIILKYNNLNKFNEFRDIIADIYIFNEDCDIIDSYEIILNKLDNSNIYQNVIKLPSSAIFCLIKIRGIFREKYYYDLNYGKLWEILLYDDNNKPLKNSNYLSAITTLTNITANLYRVTDYQYTIDRLEEEIKFYPDNFIAELAYFTLLFELRRINQSTYTQRVTEILKKINEPNNDRELNALTTALRTLKKNAEADDLILKYIKKHPISKFAEDIAFKNLSNITKREEFDKSAIDFVNKFPESVYRNKVLSALISSFLQQSKVIELRQVLDTLKNVPALIFSEFAINVLKNNKIKNISESDRKILADKIINDKLINIIRDDKIFDITFNKPNYYSKFEWNYEKNKIKSELYEIIGDYYLISNDTNLAIENYIYSIKLLDKNIPKDLLEKTIDLLLKLGNNQDAFEISSHAINFNSFNDNILNYFKQAYKNLNRDTSILDSELSSILESAKNNRLVSLFFDKMERPLTYAYFKTLDGLIQDFEQTRNKISVIYFWSSWCEPCKDIIKSYSQIFNFYIDSSDIFIYSILTWEANKSDLKNVYKLIQQEKPDFPIFIDEDDILPYRIGITGLPSFVFVDKEGFIRFIQSGFTSPDNLLQDIEDRIYYMQNMTKIENDLAKELKMLKKY